MKNNMENKSTHPCRWRQQQHLHQQSRVCANAKVLLQIWVGKTSNHGSTMSTTCQMHSKWAEDSVTRNRIKHQSSNNLIHEKCSNLIVFTHQYGNIKKSNNRLMLLDGELQERQIELHYWTKAGSDQEELNKIKDPNLNRQDLESINIINKQCEQSSPKATL